VHEEPPASIRIDKWLWYARFFKTRSLASQQVAGGHVRLNGNRIAKPAQPVGPGDVLTFAQGRQIRVVRVIAAGTRRGPAGEAQALYADLTPEPDPPAATGPRFDGGGRPTGRDRRRMDRFTGDGS
jgi:ribosome-associated heat shock protein Hsp15